MSGIIDPRLQVLRDRNIELEAQLRVANETIKRLELDLEECKYKQDMITRNIDGLREILEDLDND